MRILPRPVENQAKVINGFTEQDPHPCREEERYERINGNDRFGTKTNFELNFFLVLSCFYQLYSVSI